MYMVVLGGRGDDASKQRSQIKTHRCACIRWLCTAASANKLQPRRA